jgi:hypothetical protein
VVLCAICCGIVGVPARVVMLLCETQKKKKGLGAKMPHRGAIQDKKKKGLTFSNFSMVRLSIPPHL